MDSSAAETINLASSDTSLVTVPATIEFLAGEDSKSVTLTIIDNDLFANNPSVTVTASGQNHADVMTTINVINDEILSLTTDFSSNTTSDSVDSLVTKQDTFTVTGVTAPGATVQADNDGNGAFDEVSTVADGSGNYSLDVPLVHTSANNGMNVVQLRAVIPAESISTTTDQTNVHRAVGSVVRFETNQDFDNDGNLDFFDAELLDADAPITVANFLSYTTTAATGTERFDDLLCNALRELKPVQTSLFRPVATT